MSPAISFVVPVRNDASRLLRCLRSINANGSAAMPIEIVVVDNGSNDGSAEVARDAGALVVVSGSASVAELRNIGAAESTGAVLAFVDADHEITATWVRAAVQTLRDPGVAACGALCHAPIDGTWVQRAYGLLRGIPHGQREVEWLGSGNMVVRRLAFQAAGGFDAALTTCEDVDLCNRLLALGHRIVSNADMKSVHYGDPATLRGVFKGELWRGRDNLRVSFRGRMSWRGLPSVVIPILDLAMLALVGGGVAMALAGSITGVRIAAGAAGIVASAAALRVVRLLSDGRRIGPVRLVQVWMVACANDLGRALALVVRTRHRSVSAEMAAAAQ